MQLLLLSAACGAWHTLLQQQPVLQPALHSLLS
jgi:hypothetical protein